MNEVNSHLVFVSSCLCTRTPEQVSRCYWVLTYVHKFWPNLNILYQYLLSNLTLLSYVRMWRTWLHLGRIGAVAGGTKLSGTTLLMLLILRSHKYRATSSPLFVLSVFLSKKNLFLTFDHTIHNFAIYLGHITDSHTIYEM